MSKYLAARKSKRVYASKGETCKSRKNNYLCKDRSSEDGCEGTNCPCTHSGKKGDDYPGFPMIQNYNFNGKKFCGKRILKEVTKDSQGVERKEYYSYRNAGMNKKCLASENNCGSKLSPICISKDHKCPITRILFQTNENFEEADQ